MVKCTKCHRHIREYPFKCHHCGRLFCSRHRLPEDHYCKEIIERRRHNQEKWKETIKTTIPNNNGEIIETRKKHYFVRMFKKIKYWISDTSRNHYSYSKRFDYFLGLLIKLIISIVAFIIINTNITKLNEIILGIIKLGSVLLLISLFFIIRYSYFIIKEVFNWHSRQRRWIKYVIVIIILLFVWYAYENRDNFFNPVIKVYNKTNFSLMYPLSFQKLNLTGITKDNKTIQYRDIEALITGPSIDEEWVHNFISLINEHRSKRGYSTLKETSGLNSIAEKRFNKMMENPMITHYGAEQYNVGEVVFYPEGFSEEDYVLDIQKSAPLHWDLLIDSMFSTYGYHIGEGETVGITGYCSTTELPGPNIDVEEFFKQRGCSTTRMKSTWLVIDMS